MKSLRFLFLLAVLSLLVSCGAVRSVFDQDTVRKRGVYRQFNTSNDIFRTYISSFELAGSLTIGDVPVNFGDTEGNSRVGVCFSYHNDGVETKEVIINRNWWNANSEASRESLIFHELGHCLLGRSHSNATINVGGETIKASLMAGEIVSSRHYLKYKRAYWHELFNQGDTSGFSSQ